MASLRYLIRLIKYTAFAQNESFFLFWSFFPCFCSIALMCKTCYSRLQGSFFLDCTYRKQYERPPRWCQTSQFCIAASHSASNVRNEKDVTSLPMQRECIKLASASLPLLCSLCVLEAGCLVSSSFTRYHYGEKLLLVSCGQKLHGASVLLGQDRG